MKKTLSILAIFTIGFIVLTGQKFDNNDPRWNPHPASTRFIPVGQYDNLPTYPNTDNYVNPNTVTQYIRTPQGVFAVSPNFRLHPTNAPGTQSETIITSSLNNPNLMFGSANIFWGGSYFSTGGYISTNGGLNWYGGDTTVRNSGDPAPMIDKDGVYLISFITQSYSMGASYSTNYGLTWAPAITFPGATTNADKNLSGTNYASSSPYYGHSYTVYTEFGVTYTNRILFTKTTNSGVSWSNVQVISPPTASGHHHQGCDVTAGPEGNVYAVWANCTTNGQNSTEDSLGFGKSTDGGVTWTARNNAANMNGIRSGSFGPWGVRVAGFPRLDIDRSGGPRNGWIYVVAPEKNFVGGDAADVFLWRSSDQGTTWSAPIRVNQDAANGKLQYHAAINVDAGGGINVVYHDCRNSNNNDSVDTYVNRSVDGGTTWTEVKVNDAKFRPAPMSGLATGYQGDYIGITSGNNRIIPNWADNRVGRYQSWAAIVDIGPSIAHTNLGNTEQLSGTREINCIITPAGSPITPSTVKLYYSKDNPTLTSNVTMTNSSGDNWTANLPISGAGLYRYYITATDGLMRTATYPAGAPGNTISFIAATDTSRPVIVHNSLVDVPKVQWPATVTATVTDNIGVDSAWVKWYKNNPSNGIKQFKLTNTGGSSYSAEFNSVNGDVQPGDSISYRVFARDNSIAHNTDSTTLRTFKIIAQATSCVGTGTTSTSYPFYTLYEDSRTQMLFKAAELMAGGGGAGFISKLGFTFLTVGSPAMSGFSIKMQTISGTTISSWTTTGWTQVLDSASYTPPGTGLQYINLENPFYWNGTGNLLIEVCFDNDTWSSNSTVAGTSQTGTVVHNHVDNSAGCNLTATSTASTRPNICLVINTATSVNPVGTTLPQTYSLSQNYPNPFNPSTKINFAIPKQGFVTLKIYDVLGREVRTLVNEIKAAGNYTVDFNASEYSSGVYFYKLESSGYSNIKKMMLIK
ncbi:MAG: T9SS type A sorting domain-containing protein [Ignavibacteria bacterium]